MSADLVESHDIQQTFAHDLESFFWVLLWMVLNYVETSWKGAELSTFLEIHFNPERYEQTEGGGVVTGTTKRDFLTNDNKLTKDDFQIPRNPILVEFLIYLKHTVSSRFDETPLEETSKFQRSASSKASYEHKLKQYKERLEYMKDHSEMLRLFSIALDPSKERDWPGDDKATPQHRPVSISKARRARYGTKRSRTIQDVGGNSSGRSRHV